MRSAKHWTRTNIGRIAELATGTTPPSKTAEYFDGLINWYTPQDVVDQLYLGPSMRTITEKARQDKKARFFKKGTILLTAIGNVGRVGILRTEASANQQITGITLSTDAINVEYLFYWILGNRPEVYARTSKATLPIINQAKIKEIPVAYPSLAEQHRLVARIKECMEWVEEIEKNSRLINVELRALFPAFLHESFNEVRKAAPIKRLEDIADIKGGGSLPKGASVKSRDESVLLVKVGDMNEVGNERIIQTSRSHIPLSQAINKVIDSGAVIFPKRGGAIATNKKRLLGRPAMIDPNLMALIPKPALVHSEYLYYWTQTLDLTEISNGGVIPQLNRKDLAPLEIPVPNLKAQEFLVSALDQAEACCSELRTLFNSASQERHALRESILRKAFAGEL